MSKLFDQYLILKKEDPDKLYLFRCGKFYIFLDEDCEFINNYVVLKKTPFSKNVLKCGFPDQSLEDYIRVFQNLNLNVEVIENEKNKEETLDVEKKEKEVCNKIKSLNIDVITPIEALKLLSDFKEDICESRNTRKTKQP